MYIPERPVPLSGWAGGTESKMREEGGAVERGIYTESVGRLYRPFPKSKKLIVGRYCEPENSGALFQLIRLLIPNEPQLIRDSICAA